MALATATVAAITVAATTAATVGAVVGAVGLGLSLIGLVTKNKTLSKVGMIAGIAGGAMTLGAFAASGAASAFGPTGALTATGPTTAAGVETTAGAIAKESVTETAAALTNVGQETTKNLGLGAATQGLSPTGQTAASTVTTGGVTTPQNLSLAESYLAAHPPPGGLAEGVTPLSAGPGGLLNEPVPLAGTAPPAAPTVQPAPPVGNVGAGRMVTNTEVSGILPHFGGPETPLPPREVVPGGLGAPAPAPVSPSAATPSAGNVPQPKMSGAPIPPPSPDGGGFIPRVDAALTGATTKPGFLGQLTPSDKALLLSAGVQGLGGALSGLFGGLSAANQAKLQRWMQEERFQRGSYAPNVSFPKTKGIINA